jgi:sorbitol-specific phosphotransferase system component IIC
MREMIKKLLPHATFILAELFIALNIIDSYNPAMGFLTGGVSKALLAVFCVIAMLCALVQIIGERRLSRMRQEDRDFDRR